MVVSGQLDFLKLAIDPWPLATWFHPAQVVLLTNMAATEAAGLRSIRERTISAVISNPVNNRV